MTEQINILDKFGFKSENGFIRFARGNDKDKLSTFMFHVREIRDLTVQRGQGIHRPSGNSVQVVRLYMTLTGGQSAFSGSIQPERVSELQDLAGALLDMRDVALGLEIDAPYQIDLVDSTFYGSDTPVVYWDLPKEPSQLDGVVTGRTSGLVENKGNVPRSK